MTTHAISRADIMAPGDYARVRKDRRREMAGLKANRRLAVGPDATLYFENHDTILYQVHEMLHIEGGGEAQIPDELEAYNPLIPKGRELVATLMIEIPEEARRRRVLAGLGGIEDTLSIQVAGRTIKGIAETDTDRTTAAGKASSVQFIHFSFSEESVAAFRERGASVVVAVGHRNYGHMAVVPEATRAALAEDFD